MYKLSINLIYGSFHWQINVLIYINLYEHIILLCVWKNMQNSLVLMPLFHLLFIKEAGHWISKISYCLLPTISLHITRRLAGHILDRFETLILKYTSKHWMYVKVSFYYYRCPEPWEPSGNWNVFSCKETFLEVEIWIP